MQRVYDVFSIASLGVIADEELLPERPESPDFSPYNRWNAGDESQMITLQKVGGVAALVEALAYIIGFAVIATLLNPGNTESWSQAQKLAFVLDRKVIFQTWTIFIYVFFGVVLVVLTIALHERFNTIKGALMPIATSFGLIWAGLVISSGMVASVGLETVAKLHSQDVGQAVVVWAVIGAVQDGLGGGVEIVGGLWVLLISAAALRSSALPRFLSYLGVVIGMAGVLTVAPPLSSLGAVFGLGQIVWFIWIGVLMLRRDAAQPSVATDGALRRC